MNTYRISLFVLAMVGLLVSSYLTYVYVLGGPILCNGGHGCELIRASQQAKFFGISTPLYGVTFYLVLALLTWLVGLVRGPWLRHALLVWTAGGFLVSVYLTYVEAFVIRAWCLWCVMSAIVATLAFVVVWVFTGLFQAGLPHRRVNLPDTEVADTVKEL